MISSITLIKRAFNIFLASPKRYLAIMAIPAALTFISTYLDENGPDANEFSFATVLFVISILATMAMSVALVHAIADTTLTVADAYKKTKGQFIQYFALSMVLFIIVLIGLFLLVIPGIYFAVVYSFATFFLLLEGKKIRESLSSSKALVKGKWWGVALRLLALLAVFILLAIVFELLSSLLSMPFGDDFGYALSSTLGLLATPIGIAFTFELYKDLKGSEIAA